MAQYQLNISVSSAPQHRVCTAMPQPQNTPLLLRAGGLDPAGISAHVIAARFCRPRSRVYCTCRRGTRLADRAYLITHRQHNIVYTRLQRDFRRRLVRRRHAVRVGPASNGGMLVPPPFSVRHAVGQWVIRAVGEKWLRETAGNIVKGQWVRRLLYQSIASVRGRIRL